MKGGFCWKNFAGHATQALRADVAEFAFPRGFAILVDRRAAEDREESTDCRPFRDIFDLAVQDASEEALDGIVGDVALRFDGVYVARTTVMDHALARGGQQS